MTEETCMTCKHVGTHGRPKIMSETGFGDQLMFEDSDETVYTCHATGACEHSGKEIGTVPITCSSWALSSKHDPVKIARLAELDRKIAAFETRSAGSTKGSS